MAQLGEFDRARHLLRRAARGFARHESLERARCVVAEAEVALAARDLARPPRSLEAAALSLEARGDHQNALLGRLCAARRSLLLGRVEDAERQTAKLDLARAARAARALGHMLKLDVALRRFRLGAARATALLLPSVLVPG